MPVSTSMRWPHRPVGIPLPGGRDVCVEVDVARHHVLAGCVNHFGAAGPLNALRHTFDAARAGSGTSDSPSTPFAGSSTCPPVIIVASLFRKTGLRFR